MKMKMIDIPTMLRLPSFVVVLLLLGSSSITTRTSGVRSGCHAFTVPSTSTASTAAPTAWHASGQRRHHRHNNNHQQLYYNIYDDWRSDAVVDTMHLDEENVELCLEEFIESDYGQQMFGCNKKASDIGISGMIEFVELSGPEVTLQLSGRFWHRRETVLGKAAVWLNARMPEITDVVVSDVTDLQDFEEIVDELSGEVLFTKDKRSEDFNGDRSTMEYQGLDPDVRGPFPPGAMTAGSSMINPI